MRLIALAVLFPLVLAAGTLPVRGGPGKPDPVSLRILPGRAYAVCEHRGSYEGIVGAFATLVVWMGKEGLKADGPAVGVFYDDPEALPAEKLRSEARVPVAMGKQAAVAVPSGDCKIARDPPRLVLRTIHKGPYDGLGATFERLLRAIPNRGVKYTGPMRQVYITNAQTTPPEDTLVEAQLVVAPTGPSDVLVYADRGTFPEGLLAISDALDAGGLTFRPVGAAEVTDGRLKKRGKTLLVPGGWAVDYRDLLGPKGAREIKSFVEKGGGYAGICAGAFFAAKLSTWEKKPFEYCLDLFPGVPAGPLTEIAPWPKFALTTLRIDPSHAITRGLGKARTALYYGGPVLAPKKGAKVNVLATYGEKGGPAIVAFKRGRGKVFLSGVHPEIQLGPSRERIGWPKEAVEREDPEPDDDLLLRGLRWTMGKKPVKK